MFPIEQSSFLHALGYAIGHSLWQVPVLWLVYYVLVHIGTWASNRRYALAVSMSIAGFGWFLLTLGYYATRLSVDSQVETIGVVWQQVGQAASEQKGFLFIYHSAMATLRSLAPYLSCAYLVVMMVLSVRLSFGFRQVKQLRSVGISKAAIDWRLFVDDHAKLLGIKKKVQVLVSNIATSPYTIGFFKPIILIPLASLNHLSTQQMEAILLHELAHIRRHDYLLNIILQVVEISLFFNPFMRLLLKQARLERENCCDDWVLQFRYNPADYARALLAIEKYSMQSLLAMGSNNNNEFELLNRVKRMVAPERKSFNYRQQLGLLFFITLLGLGFTVVVPRPGSANNATEKTAAQPAAVEKQTPAVVPAAKSVKQPAPAVDLVKTLENIQQHIEKAVDSKEFKEQSERMQVEAEAMASKIVAESEPYIKQMEEAASNIEIAATDKITSELDAIKYSAAVKNGLKMAELYANTNWDKIIGPALEQSGKALAMIPGIFDRKEGPDMPLPPAPPTAPNPPTRLQLLKAQKAINAEQKELTVKIKEGQRMALNLGKVQRMINDSIRVAFRNASRDMERSREILASQYQRSPRAPRQAATAQPAPEPATYDFAYNTVYNGNWNSDNSGDDAEDGSDEDEDAGGNVLVLNNKKSPCAVTPAVSVRDRSVSKSTATVVLNGKVLNKKIKKEWVEVQQNWDQVWNSDKMQQEMQQVQDEIQKGLKELEKFNIKANISTKESRKGKVITIEVETLR